MSELDPLAAETSGEQSEEPTAAAPELRDVRTQLPIPMLRRFESEHTVTIRGKQVAFKVVAEDTRIYDDNDEPVGHIFSFAYLGESPDPQRPVVFVTGGGPGAASDGMQVGLLGPWVVPSERLDPSGASAPTAPFPFVENEHCLLDVADLVFIDPVGTGWSRAVGHGRGTDFWGIDEDAGSIAAFIQQWVTVNGRWDSPKFFAGASYGGSRATFVADALSGGLVYQGFARNVALNGIISLVNGLGMPVGFKGIGDEALAASALPAMAATAWYHESVDRAGRTVEEYFDEVCSFALGDYVSALRAKEAGLLEEGDKATVLKRAAAYVGVPEDAFGGELQLSPFAFPPVALGPGGPTVGLYDGRYSLPRSGPDIVMDDAGLGRSFAVLTGTWANVLHAKLGIKIEVPYSSCSFRGPYANWNYNHQPSLMGEFDTSGTAADHAAMLMNRNNRLYLFVGNGRYDLVAPAARYAVSSADIPVDRLTMKEYNTGHDIHDDPARSELQDDLRDFLLRASGK